MSVVTILGTTTDVASFLVTDVVNVFGVHTFGVSTLFVVVVKSGLKIRVGERLVGVILVSILPERYLIESSLIILSVVLLGAELAILYVTSKRSDQYVLLDSQKIFAKSPITASPSFDGE